jgi:predicted pyridoxine 5'-phosphate oxidase superfamily flavin-nucleotide-binding protein
LGKVHTEIDDNVRKFIEDQQVFFVATAPLDPNGHVNLSPKGLDSLRILGPKRVLRTSCEYTDEDRRSNRISRNSKTWRRNFLRTDPAGQLSL